MRWLLFVMGILSALLGFAYLASAKTGIHEIAAYVLFLTAAVLVSGAGVIEAVNRLREAVQAGPRS